MAYNENNVLTGADYLLLLLYLNDQSPIYGAIRLTKMMFLFDKEVAKELKKQGIGYKNPPEFFAYNFGPFSKDVYEQVELFRGIGFIKVTNINANEEMAEVDDWEEGPFIDELSQQDKGHINMDGKYYKYTIISTGTRYVEEKILPNISCNEKELLSKFKEKITHLYPKQILKYVYTKYPEYTDKSLIKEEVLGDE
jgi:hypothetical protein